MESFIRYIILWPENVSLQTMLEIFEPGLVDLDILITDGVVDENVGEFEELDFKIIAIVDTVVNFFLG